MQDLFTNLTIFILGKTRFTNVEIVGKLIQTSSGLVIGTRNPRSKCSLLQNLNKCKRPYFSSQYFLKYLETSRNILRNLEVSWDFLRYFEMRNIKFWNSQEINKYWKSNLPIFNEPWLIHHETFSPLIELSAQHDNCSRCHLFQFSQTSFYH